RKSSSSTDRNDLGASTGEPRTTVRIIWTMSASLGRGALAALGWRAPDDGLAEDLYDWFRGELPIGFSFLGLLRRCPDRRPSSPRWALVGRRSDLQHKLDSWLMSGSWWLRSSAWRSYSPWFFSCPPAACS